MSFQAAGWAIEQQIVKDPTARHVLLVLASYADKQGKSAFPSVDSLIEDTGLSRRTIFKKLEELTELGVVTRGDQAIVAAYVKRADKRPVCYDLCMPPMFEKRGAADAPRAERAVRSERGASNAPRKLSTEDESRDAPNAPREETGCISRHDGVHLAHERGASDDVAGCTTCTQSVSKHPLISEGNAQAPEQTAHTPKDETENLEPVTSGFERFWDAWPSASGRKQAKAICESHWLANGLDADAELIVMHVRAMKLTQHWKTGGDPTPIRYLEQKRWRDGEPEPMATAPAARSAADDAPWWESDSGTNAKGKQHGVEREKDEPTPMYLLRVCKAAGRGPWIDHMLAQAKRSNSDKWYRQVVNFLGEALMPTDFYAS
jgi:Helix-turn-helix domain